MQPFPGTQPALFPPMPAGPWPQQMFANFGSPPRGPPMQTQHPQPPPPPPPQPQPQSQPSAEPRRGLRLTPTSPLSPAPSYRKGIRGEGERQTTSSSRRGLFQRRSSLQACALVQAATLPASFTCAATIPDSSCSAAPGRAFFVSDLRVHRRARPSLAVGACRRGEGGAYGTQLRRRQRRAGHTQRRYTGSLQRLLAISSGALLAPSASILSWHYRTCNVFDRSCYGFPVDIAYTISCVLMLVSLCAGSEDSLYAQPSCCGT